MPRSYNTAVQTALDAGRVVDRTLVTMHLGSGTYGFWSGMGPFSYNSINFVGAGSLIEIEGVQQTSDLSAVAVVGRLTAIENTDLTPDKLATIEAETYHQRPCSISTAYFNADTYALLNVEVEYDGIIDRIVHTETIDGRAVLEVYLESNFRDHQRTGYRMRSHNDQVRIDATDTGLRYVNSVGNEAVTFGRLDKQAIAVQQGWEAYNAKKKRGGLFGLFG